MEDLTKQDVLEFKGMGINQLFSGLRDYRVQGNPPQLMLSNAI
jgi:hypothetical protein